MRGWNNFTNMNTSKDGTVNDFGSEVPKTANDEFFRNLGDINRILAPDLTSATSDDSKTKPFTRVQWSKNDHDSYVGVGCTQKTLEPGVYDIKMDRSTGEAIFVRKQLSIDDLLNFPDSKSCKILKEIEDFWNRSDIFKEYGFLHRRGYILYGPAGSGKTAIVQQIIKKIIDDGGIVFICDNPEVFAHGLSTFRQIEPFRKIVCIFEDIDSIIKDYGDDSLLSLLDGEKQIDKVLNIATTNYPEVLEKRIIGRPRRFDRVIEIGMPEEMIRRVYFSKKLKIKDDELDMWVSKTEKFSFAAMAELVISVKCLGHELDEAIEIIKDLMETKKSSEDFEDHERVGF